MKTNLMKFLIKFQNASLCDAVEHGHADIVHLLLTRDDIKIDLTSISNH